MHFFVDKPSGIWDNKDNGERLLERDTPVRSCGTASLSEDFWMTTLYAKGLVKGDSMVAYLWGLGNYRYEIERMFAGAGPAWKPAGRITHSEVFESSYEEAMIKFEKMVDKVVMLWYNELNLESIPNGLSYIAE